MRAELFYKADRPWSTHRRAARIFSWVASRLRNRPDSEHEMTVNRLVLSGVAFVYLMLAALLGHLTAELALTSKRWAASRRDEPASTASITRSRKSWEQAFGMIRLQKWNQYR
jgi:hypothetical protein